jgi:succinoglycan biosynthesis protein ExoH
MTKENISSRIDFLRFLMVIGLVLLHFSEFEGAGRLRLTNFNFDTHPYTSLLTNFTEHFFKSSVPILSVISGYLFFNAPERNVAFFLRKYKQRIRNVLLPMISWALISICLFLLIAWVSPKSYFLVISVYDVTSMKPVDWINAIFGVTRLPFNMQFWFLHDLLLTVLISPILALFLHRIPYLALGGLFLIWMGNFNIPIFFRSDVLFFFYIGAVIHTQNVPLDVITPRVAWGLMAALIILTAIRTGLPYVTPEGHWVNRLFGVSTRSLRLLSVFAFWGFVPFLLNTWLGEQMLKVSGMAFFLHAIHWPMNQIFKYSLADIVPNTGDAAMLTVFFGTSLLTIATTIMIGFALAALSPGLFSHLSGGRSINRRVRTGNPDLQPAQGNLDKAPISPR